MTITLSCDISLSQGFLLPLQVLFATPLSNVWIARYMEFFSCQSFIRCDVSFNESLLAVQLFLIKLFIKHKIRCAKHQNFADHIKYY